MGLRVIGLARQHPAIQSLRFRQLTRFVTADCDREQVGGGLSLSGKIEGVTLRSHLTSESRCGPSRGLRSAPCAALTPGRESDLTGPMGARRLNRPAEIF